jgi:predicted SprT family Zn-dependent metalloprotease
MGEWNRIPATSVRRGWRKLYIAVGGIVFLLCVASITHSLVFRYAYCPICDQRMSTVRDYGESNEKHATFYKCPKCGTGLIR